MYGKILTRKINYIFSFSSLTCFYFVIKELTKFELIKFKIIFN